MSVRIQLARIGKKKAPFYRIVAVDKRKKRDGQYLENLGTYNPLNGEIIQFHAEQFDAWISKGAIPSDTVVRIQKQFTSGNTGPQKKVAPQKPAAKTVEAAPAPEATEVKEEAPAVEEQKTAEAQQEEAKAEKAPEAAATEEPKKEEEKTEDK